MPSGNIYQFKVNKKAIKTIPWMFFSASVAEFD